MIPYYVSKNGNYRATLAGTLEGELELSSYPGRKTVNIDIAKPAGHFIKNPLARGLKYFFSNSRSIDILHLYHFKLSTALYSILYKIRNPRGTIYVKLDADRNILRYYSPQSASAAELLFRYPLRSWVRKTITRRADILSVETKEVQDLLYKKDRENLRHKLFLNPYGIPVEEFRKYYPLKIKRKKQILTVGRIGNIQKNTEMLLRALPLMKNVNGWTVKIAGPVEPGFQEKVDAFFRNNPRCRRMVQFTGNINDRKAIYKLFLESGIFVLTSRYESWGIVLTEAAYFGDYIVSTDVGCARLAVKNGKLGKIVPQNDPEALAKALDAAMTVKNSTSLSKNIHIHSEKSFDWDTVVKNLTKRIELCLKNKRK